MKLEHVLLLILLALLVVVGVFATLEEPVHGQGLPHPDHVAMAIGGDATSRTLPILGLGLVFALLQVSLFGGLLLLGLRRAEEPLFPRYLPVLGGLALLMAAFVFLFNSYRSFAVDPEASAIFLGFPAPSAWMLFGVWWTPLALVLLYMLRFDRWVYGDQEKAAFAALLERARGAETAAAAAAAAKEGASKR
jgi:hypothetical protein